MVSFYTKIAFLYHALPSTPLGYATMSTVRFCGDAGMITQQEVMDGFRCEEVTAAAEQLREIVNLFVVPPENLPSLMEQGRLSEMAKEVLTVMCSIPRTYVRSVH